MPETTSEQVALDERPVEIPPAFEAFLGRIKADKKKLMKDKAFGASADQLRNFIGTFTYPRFTEMIRLFASGIFETYSLAASNAEQLRHLHGFVTEELGHLRDEIDDLEEERHGVNPAVLDDFQQAFYALVSLLKKKLPADEETETACNHCIALLGAAVGDLVGAEREHDGEEDDPGDNNEEAEGKGSSSGAALSEREPAPESPASEEE